MHRQIVNESRAGLSLLRIGLAGIGLDIGIFCDVLYSVLLLDAICG